MTINRDENELIKHLVHKEQCPICDSGSKILQKIRTICPDSSMVVNLRECSSCRHWWNDPVPHQEYLTSLYKGSSEFVVPKNYSGMMQAELAQQPRFNKWLFRSERKSCGNRMLEIGVGGGHLFKFMIANGYKCHGIEPGGWAEFPDIFPSIESLPFETYDLIVMSDVIEHLENPRITLKSVSSKAEKGTRLYCSFPNRDSLPALLKKGRWDMVRPFGHLHYFSRNSAHALIKESGWDVVELREVNADHNRLLNSCNPLTLMRKIKAIPSYWHDQFWVKAVLR